MNFDCPDSARAVVNYRELARHYDASCRRVASLRCEAIALLGLRRGDCVLDVACGTGLSFPALRAAVGEHGSVVGVELSPDMCALAKERIRNAGWENVFIVHADALTADLGPHYFDTLLFHFTHDVLRQPKALERLLSRAKPNARIAVAGFKAAPKWAALATGFAMWRARKYLTTYEGIVAPWSYLTTWVLDFQWQPRLLGTGYIGWGNVAPPVASQSDQRPNTLPDATIGTRAMRYKRKKTFIS